MLMSQRAYARERDVQRHAIRYQINLGVIRLTPDGLIDTDQADRDWLAIHRL